MTLYSHHTMNEDQIIKLTYYELIEAFERWGKILTSNDPITVPEGSSMGIRCTNYLINLINEVRKEAHADSIEKK